MSDTSSDSYTADSRLKMLASNSQSCTALDKLVIDDLPTRAGDFSPVQYRPYRFPYRTTILISCLRRLFCCRCGPFMQRFILFAALLTTCLTWSGLLLRQQPLEAWKRGKHFTISLVFNILTVVLTAYVILLLCCVRKMLVWYNCMQSITVIRDLNVLGWRPGSWWRAVVGILLFYG